MLLLQVPQGVGAWWAGQPGLCMCASLASSASCWQPSTTSTWLRRCVGRCLCGLTVAGALMTLNSTDGFSSTGDGDLSAPAPRGRLERRCLHRTVATAAKRQHNASEATATKAPRTNAAGCVTSSTTVLPGNTSLDQN